MPPFTAVLSHAQNKKSGIIGLTFTSNQDTGVLKLQISDIKVKLDNESEFRDVDFLFFPQNIDRSFYIELDPNEQRDYCIALKGDIILSYDFRVIVFDKALGRDHSVCLEGRREGIAPVMLQQPHEYDLTTPELGMIVRLKPSPYIDDEGMIKYVVCNEDGTPNDFGIFDKHELNPTAAYIDVGRDGYKIYRGRHYVEFDWDRDTVASPPSDLWAVHVRKCDDSSQHGWFWRTSLLVTDASR